MTELTSYLDSMENRVKTLESQNDSLKQSITESLGDATKALPKTKLLSRSFFQRAFTVWGHNFVAQLIICLVLLCISLVIVLLIPGLVSYFINFSKGIPIR
jgi:lipopolysaccharide/colanic/teichoic acid biosynthesis glycosyltransferase